MNTHCLPRPIRRAAALALLAALTAAAHAEALVRYQALPNKSKVKIAGSSTIHDWTMEGPIIAGFLEVPEGYSFERTATSVATFKDAPKAEIGIPVQSIKSGNKRMDEVMLEHMKQPQHPRIAFKLQELAPKSGERKAGTPLEYVSKGELTIAGVTKTIEMPVSIEKTDDKQLKVSGEAPIRMTDYGIKPPAPNIALGLIKVGNDVKISFDWIVQLRPQK